MAESNIKHRACSRESSVSSLLASCSLSGSNSTNSDGSFQYKDKLYSSASQALQAYIDDFDLSQMYPGAGTGKINIDKCSANMPEFSNYIYKPNNAFENLDDKKSSLSLYSREHTLHDIDSISLTTDDLLRLPADGSFPFTYIGSGHGISKKSKKRIGRLNSSVSEKNKNFQEPSAFMGKDNLVTPVVYTNVNGKQCGDKIELLILKAKSNLEHCTEELPKSMKKDDSPCSLDKLEAERSWENIPVTFKSPVPVNSDDSPQQTSKAKYAKEFLEDFLNNDNQVSEDDFSKLQLKESMVPITRSLQKALHHLSRLRDLVDDTSGKQSPKM